MDDVNKKREKRLQRDRVNARERRKRKKTQMENLGRSVADITKHNQALIAQNKMLFQEVVHLRVEILKLSQRSDIIPFRADILSSDSSVSFKYKKYCHVF